jgi:hypothetical protein
VHKAEGELFRNVLVAAALAALRQAKKNGRFQREQR